MTLQLPVPPTAHARSRLPPGRDIAGWHLVLTQTVASALSPAHAQLFAQPVPSPIGMGWETEGNSVVAFGDLAPEDKLRLASVIGSILSDIRRLVESGHAPALVPLWPIIRDVPDPAHVFLVSGRPVLAAWGHHGDNGGFCAGIDDGLAGAAAAPVAASLAYRWPSYALALGLFALVSLLAGALVPWLSRMIGPPSACQAGAAQLAAVSDLQQFQLQGQNLQTVLAQLVEETAQRRLQCHRPQVQGPSSPLPGLSQAQWDHQDISVIKGCWHRFTNMSVVQLKTNKVLSVKDWHMCFDEKGSGTQTIELTDGDSCTGPLAAHFDGKSLVINEPAACVGSMDMVHSKTTCKRDSADEASCISMDDVGPHVGQSVESRFRR